VITKSVYTLYVVKNNSVHFTLRCSSVKCSARHKFRAFLAAKQLCAACGCEMPGNNFLASVKLE